MPPPNPGSSNGGIDLTRNSTIAVSCALAAALALVLIAGTAQASDAKQPQRACDISGQEQDLGASYVTSLKVEGTDCHTGKKVVKGYNRCRGVSGRECSEKVKGFKCHTRVLEESPAQFDAKVNCKRGGDTVKFSYTQNT
jgi:hypothetical protein